MEPTLNLTRQEALDLLAAVELSPFEHEALEQKLLNLVYGVEQDLVDHEDESAA